MYSPTQIPLKSLSHSVVTGECWGWRLIMDHSMYSPTQISLKSLSQSAGTCECLGCG